MLYLVLGDYSEVYFKKPPRRTLKEFEVSGVPRVLFFGALLEVLAAQDPPPLATGQATHIILTRCRCGDGPRMQTLL